MSAFVDGELDGYLKIDLIKLTNRTPSNSTSSYIVSDSFFKRIIFGTLKKWLLSLLQTENLENITFFSWVVFVITVVAIVVPRALVDLPVLSRWTGCKAETCLAVTYRFRNMFAVLVYFSTILIVLSTSTLFSQMYS